MFKKIIVGMDFSDLGERAAQAAISLAKGLGSQVVLVHVITAGGADPTRIVTEMRPGIEEQLRDASARLAQASGVKVDWGVVDGRPAEEIATFAERWKGDLIVAGSAGRSGLPRALIGSVTDRLIRISKVPVLVIGPESA